jgi:NAD(P) transhydrogenase subunit alpha
MYSRNMEKLIMHLTKEAALVLDTADEITRGMMITRGGEVVHAAVADLVAKEA